MTNKLVPLEPETEMQLAGALCITVETTNLNKLYMVNAVYRAMVALAYVKPTFPKAHGTHIVQYDTEMFIWFDEAGLIGGGEHSLAMAELSVKRHGEHLNQAKPHDDDIAVDAFAEVMKAKLKKGREEKDRGGWQGCDPSDISDMLWGHMQKGDPVDVANFAMMLQWQDAPISPERGSYREGLSVRAVQFTHDLEHDNGLSRDYRSTRAWYPGMELPQDAHDVAYLYEVVRVK